MNLIELRQKMTAKLAEAKSFLAAAGDGNLSAEKQTQYDALWADYKGLKAQVERAEALEAEEKHLAEIPDNQKGIRPNPTVEVVGDRELKKPWGSLGEQLKAIADAGMTGGQVDRRLLESKATGASASVPAEGGFLIQHDFAQGIYERAYSTGVLASRCDMVPISENADGLELPYIDETSRVDGSRWGGVRVYRANEAGTVAASKPTIGNLETRLEDLKGIAYATRRLLTDAVAMTTVFNKAFAQEFAYKLDDEIFNGTGAGQCLGLVASPALVTVAKETNQVAQTIDYKNIVKMRARLWARSRANAVWFINQDIEPQLHTMSLAVGTGGVPVYLPASGAAGMPFDTLFGRPVIPIEQAATLGTVGDIVLADLSEYLLIRKGGLDAATSMHVKFVEDELAFRFVMRVNGQPKWKTALTPAKGSNTQSPFVALATRA